jgi:hypothetical protein
LDSLSGNQEKFLAIRVYGVSDAAAARAVGISPGTVYKWKDDPEFRAIYDEVINNPVQFAAEVATFGLVKAINKLVALSDHNNIRVQQWAIDKLISIAGLEKQRVEVTRRDEPDLDSLLDRLEEHADDRRNGGRA